MNDLREYAREISDKCDGTPYSAYRRRYIAEALEAMREACQQAYSKCEYGRESEAIRSAVPQIEETE